MDEKGNIDVVFCILYVSSTWLIFIDYSTSIINRSSKKPSMISKKATPKPFSKWDILLIFLSIAGVATSVASSINNIALLYNDAVKDYDDFETQTTDNNLKNTSNIMVSTCCAKVRAGQHQLEDEREVLPASSRPTHYDLTIAPNPAMFGEDAKVEDFTFTGSVSISLDVCEDTDSIVLNSSELEIKSCELVVNDAEKYISKTLI